MTKQPNPLTKSRKVQKAGSMRSRSRHSSRVAARFGHRFGLTKHRIALSFRNAGPFCPSRRFSARFGLFGRCAQLCQNGWHAAAHLPRSNSLLPPFPRSKARLSKLARQDQLIHSCCHDQALPLKLLRRRHMDFRPEQILLEKAVGVLMREAIAIGRDDLAGRQGSWTDPAEPTLGRIALGPFGPFSQHAVHNHLNLSCLSKMQMVPGGYLDRLALLVCALPLLIGLSPGFGLACLKQGSIFTRGSSFACTGWWGCSIELAIALEAHERFYLQALTGQQKGSCRIPAICQHTYPFRQERPQVFQLRNGYPNSCLRTCNPLLRKDRSPATALIGQEHHGRELPSHTDWFAGMRQIADIDHASIGTALSFRSSYGGRVDTDPDSPFSLGQQGLCPDLAPALALDPAIFQRFIDARPFSAKSRRQRQFGQRSGGTLAGQGVCQLEERIAAASKTLPDLMTHLPYCVKVHLSNAPRCFVLRSHYSLWQSSAMGIAFLGPVSLNTNQIKIVRSSLPVIFSRHNSETLL